MSGYPVTSVNQKGFSVGAMSLKTAAVRSEIGVGALMPWNDGLYYLTYLADYNAGRGGELRYIDKNGGNALLDTHNSCHAGRMVHKETNQLCFGEYVIESDGTIHKIALLAQKRVSGWARHLTSPTTKAYCITMGNASGVPALLIEVDLTTYVGTQLYDMSAQLGLTESHFKACFTVFKTADLATSPFANSRLIVCSNVQSKPGSPATSGILATFDGSTFSSKYTESHIEIAGNYDGGQGMAVFAIGKDHRSPFFLMPSLSLGTPYFRYRFPASTFSQDYALAQEWMRIRQTQTDRLMANAFGTWFQLASWQRYTSAAGVQNFGTIGTTYPNIEAVGRYVDTITDFCVWNGQLVYGTNNTTEQQGAFIHAGQSQSCIKFTDVDSLCEKKPIGSGHFWYKEQATISVASDPMLIRGYDKKSIQIYNGSATPINVAIKVVQYSDIYTLATVAVAAGAFVTYQMPSGFTADWVTLTSDATVTPVTAWIECS